MNIQELIGKRVGVWGFGIVGKSAVNYLKDKAAISVLDKRNLTQDELEQLNAAHVQIYNQDSLESFLQTHDFIIPSAGIDLRPYSEYQSKWVSELDIFGTHFQKPIIAITGTIGKTTTTHFLSHVLQTAGFRVACAGNIGTGLFDIIDHSDNYDMAVIEVSSFQLELCTTFAPHIALWTNFYPNHLDRHTTVTDYLHAKLRIIKHQSMDQYALMPFTLQSHTQSYKNSVNYFSIDQVATSEHLTWYIRDGYLFKHYEKKLNIADLGLFPETIIPIAATLDSLSIPLSLIHEARTTWKPYEHRLEKVTTFNGIDFYNDSKSTIMEATIAAVHALRHKPIILLLGGLSKGVDRSHYFHQLQTIKTVICFGTEADQLHDALQSMNITSDKASSLEQAVDIAISHANNGDQVLLSPGGSSYDLFKNYEERGRRFKELIEAKNINFKQPKTL